MTLREFLQEILPTEVDFQFLPDDLAEMNVVYRDNEMGLVEPTKVQRDFNNNQLIIE